MQTTSLAAAITLVASLGVSFTEAKSQAGWSVNSSGPSAVDYLISCFGAAEAVNKLEVSATASGLTVVDSGETKGGKRFLILRGSYDHPQVEKFWDDAQHRGVAIGPMIATHSR